MVCETRGVQIDSYINLDSHDAGDLSVFFIIITWEGFNFFFFLELYFIGG